tara:strand:+ start:514 stop:1836 length:1323 start_codon:yes stop_codon:yes gene_type:complete
MAEIVVERSPLAEFLDEMPSLIMQYKQMQMAQEERIADREYRERMANKSIELEASKSLYKEAVSEYNKLDSALMALENKYSEAVGSVDNLGEMYKGSGLDVVTDIYKGEATNYQARADNALENIQALKNKINIVQGSLYGDVKRVQNIMAGGAGFEGGASAEGWDLGDLGLLAYETQFGESSPTVKAMFKNNPGMMTSSLASLQKTEEAMKLSKEKRQYYSDKDANAKEISARSEAELTFGSLIGSSAITSGKQQFDGLSMIEANFDDTTTEDDKSKVANSKNALRTQIGKDFAFLLGDLVSEDMYFDYSEDYFEMHNLAKGQSAVRQGRTAYGNWSIFNNYVQKANANYINAIQSGDTNKALMLNQMAIKYFGMPDSKDVQLSTFANDMNKHFSKTILAGFESSNQILPEDNQFNLDNLNNSNLSDLNDNEWESLLGDD